MTPGPESGLEHIWRAERSQAESPTNPFMPLGCQPSSGLPSGKGETRDCRPPLAAEAGSKSAARRSTSAPRIGLGETELE